MATAIVFYRSEPLHRIGMFISLEFRVTTDECESSNCASAKSSNRLPYCEALGCEASGPASDVKGIGGKKSNDTVPYEVRYRDPSAAQP